MGCVLSSSASPPRRRPSDASPRRPDPRLSNPPNHLQLELVAAGWPLWLAAAAPDAVRGWTPRPANSYQKLHKIGRGTYGNVYKGRELLTGRIVAMKNIKFDGLVPSSIRFMAREICILRRLDHPNVVKLEGLIASRTSTSMYLIFEYMDHDLAGLNADPEIKFSDSQVKCYMKQLLMGLEHCHDRGVLHRDIKGPNLLLNNSGVLKIADFGLAALCDTNDKKPMTSKVVTLWYRPPELLLGAIEYGVGVDLWSTGCILAELLAGRPVLPGRSEVDQLYKIFKLCGSPTEEYWKKSKLLYAKLHKPEQPYEQCIRETFRDFSPPSLSLIETLLAIDPADRQTASAALRSEFFKTQPLACEPSSLPQYPPSKEMDAKRRKEEAMRLRANEGRKADEASEKLHSHERAVRVVPAFIAHAELEGNLDRSGLIAHSYARTKIDKFCSPPDALFKIHPSQRTPKVTMSGPITGAGVVVCPRLRLSTLRPQARNLERGRHGSLDRVKVG